MTTLPTLITGSMGCLGTWATAHLVRLGQPVISFDLSADRSRLNLLLSPDEQESITFIQGDLTDYNAVHRGMADHGVGHVIHLAALQVPFCRANPVLGANVNVTGTVNVFEAAKQVGIKHIAYASSIAVYGPPSDYPPGLIAHDAPQNPRTLYGVYKVANEGTARIYWQDYGISSIGLRPHTVYGLGRDQGLTSDPTKAMLAAAAGVPFTINFGSRVQMQHASDVARQFIDAASQPVEGAPVYGLGTPPVSIAEVIAHIQAVKPGAEITHTDKVLPFAEGFDDSALRAAVPVVYETPLSHGVMDTIRAFERLLTEGRISAPKPA
jgi:nucleoside-diphosphate-sugar epimerase